LTPSASPERCQDAHLSGIGEIKTIAGIRQNVKTPVTYCHVTGVSFGRMFFKRSYESMKI